MEILENIWLKENKKNKNTFSGDFQKLITIVIIVLIKKKKGRKEKKEKMQKIETLRLLCAFRKAVSPATPSSCLGERVKYALKLPSTYILLYADYYYYNAHYGLTE